MDSSEVFVIVVLCRTNRHALHLDEPGGAADGGKGEDGGDVGIFLAEHRANLLIVRAVAQIDDELHGIVHRHSCLAEERFDVLPHASRLLLDVAFIHHLAFVVDARRAGDDGMVAVAELEERASLEGDTVLCGAVEVCRGIEVALLFRLETAEGIASQLYDGLGVEGASADACGGDVVRLGYQAVLREILPSCQHEALVLNIDVADEEPRADAVVLQSHLVLLEELFVVLKQRLRLAVAASFGNEHTHRPQVLVAIVSDDCRAQPVGCRNDFCAALHVEPQGEFAPVEWRLLNVRDGAGVVLPHEWTLIGGVGEEVAFEDGLCALHFFGVEQPGLCLTDAMELFHECFAARFHVQHRVPFCRFSLRREGCQFYRYTEFFQ